MKYFIEGLQKKQVRVLKALGPQMASREFYLAGGTALAIHLAHRISVDLDWFTPHPFADGSRRTGDFSAISISNDQTTGEME